MSTPRTVLVTGGNRGIGRHVQEGALDIDVVLAAGHEHHRRRGVDADADQRHDDDDFQKGHARPTVIPSDPKGSARGSTRPQID